MRAARRAVPRVVVTHAAAPVFGRRYLDLLWCCLGGGVVLPHGSSSAVSVMRCAASPGCLKIRNLDTHLIHD